MLDRNRYNMLCYVVIVLAKFCFSLANPEFIEPKEAVDTQEIFQYQADDEFIINNYAVTWNRANYICSYTFNGSLAYFDSQEEIDFLAEYLGDSDLSLNTLWVNLQKSKFLDGDWITLNNKTANESIFKCPYHTLKNLCPNCTESKNCGAVVRMFHVKLCFVKLHCNANRKFICRRSITAVSKSTHLDWIKIGSKLFKIFYERLSYESAAEACSLHDIDSKLAFIETYHEAHTLGRFLLIGRPSKERVWIGARWEYNAYEFEEERFVLSNTTEASGYPPWLRGRVSKPYGCLLLDRHLSNKTYFVESSCSRLHAFMCYKRYKPPPFTDVCLEGDYDWRIYYTAKDWFKASKTCQDSDSTGRLPYIESQDMPSILHVMESSKFDVLYHVWLGAYFEDNVWTWTYNNLVLSQEKSPDGFPPWVQNKTFNLRIEQFNSCLNLDRENSLEAMIYGTLCYYPQYFLCQYDKGTICNNMTTHLPIVTINYSTTTSEATPTTTTSTTTTTTSTTTTSTTTTPTTTTPTTTTRKPSTTRPAVLLNGTVFHTKDPWFKSTDKSYAEPELKQRRRESHQKYTRNSRTVLYLRTTDWPSDDHKYSKDHANLDYLIFN